MTRMTPELQEALAREHEARWERGKRLVDVLSKKMQVSGHSRMSLIFENAARRFYEDRNDAYVLTLQGLRRIPVSFAEFLESSDFVGGLDMEVWPQIRRDLLTINADIWAGEDPVSEYIDSGATGTGKTLKASLTQAYQLYLLHCLKNPQRFYDQAASTGIVMVMASSNVSTTRDVLYKPFREMVSNMRFFRRFTQWNDDKKSRLEFSNGVRVEPVTATNQGIIGRAIISAHVDEANYMAVVVGSARAENEGSRGTYDQAQTFYRQVSLRRRSRFSSRMPIPGMIILSSSIRHQDDFLERRIEEVRDTENDDGSKGQKGVQIFRHKQYEVQPSYRFSDTTFKLLVGTPEYATRILGPEEQPGIDYPEDAQVEEVPEDYRYDFMHRPEDALRDVCGISSVNISPFITQRQKITESFERWREGGNTHPVRRANVDLVDHGMPVLVPDQLDADIETTRFVHIDLSKTKDRCGICMLRVDHMREIEVEKGVWQNLPHGVVELAITIQPSQAAELDIKAVREWVMALKLAHDVPIHSITYDGFNSAESIQALVQAGVRSKVISMDRTDGPYQALKDALYQDRLDMVPNPILRDELTQLDKDEKTGKIDHPKKGSKDLSDAVAGAWYAAIRSREIRTLIYYTDGRGKRVRPPRRKRRQAG